MTRPRQVLPGTTYLLTRRCTQRRFLLRPSKHTNEVFEYCLAYAAQRFGVQVHGYCVLSNHWHVVLTDVHGNLPEFAGWVHKYVAKALNQSLRRWENFWSNAGYSAVRLVEADDVLSKLVYTLSNPVAAGLVHRSRYWPGLINRPDDYRKGKRCVGRPPGYFRAKGPLPEEVSLEMLVPSQFDGLDANKFGSLLGQALAVREQELNRRHKEGGRGYMGAKKVRKQRPIDSPRTRQRKGRVNPRVAARDKWKRVEALLRLKDFVNSYKEALARWKQGEGDVFFPAGTYWLCRYAGVKAHAPP